MKKERLDRHENKAVKWWGKRGAILFLVFSLLVSSILTNAPIVEAVADSSGGTYFTDTDNWGGGGASTAADGDLDVGLKNQDKLPVDNYAKYPVEFKMTNVAALPTKSAHLLIRAFDVDEYDTSESTVANGEWDRVYFSSNPSDIALGTSYTSWPVTDKWTTKIAESKIEPNGQGYKKEIKQSAYLGTLSGKDEVWNTSVLTFKPEDFERIAIGDNYVGVTIHHFNKDPRSLSFVPNTNWEMKVDWGQLVIDGGGKRLGEITDVGFKVEKGKITLNTSFLPKQANNNFSVEVNVIEKRLVNGEIVEKNLGLDQKLFTKPANGTAVAWKDIVIANSVIDPSKEYYVNIILFEDRGGGREEEKKTNSGEVQHIYSFSTFVPVATDIVKSALQYESTSFTANDFKAKYFKNSGIVGEEHISSPNGDSLYAVKINSLPAADKGLLMFEDLPVTVGQEIATNKLSKLSFVPAAGANGFTGAASFLWNGFNGTHWASKDATVLITANTAPVVDPILKAILKGETLSFKSLDFTDKFEDTTELSKLKIVSLPDAEKGKLVLQSGGGPAVAVVQGQEIAAADLAKLKFIPAANATGTVAFTWNASDGNQYAKDNSTVTITINTPPVVSNVNKAGLAKQTITFTANDFALSPAYKDAEAEELVQIRIDLSNDFATKGKLWYSSVGESVYVTPGNSSVLSKADLDSLKFEPAAALPEGSIVSFPWVGYDGKQYAEASALVIIAYNGRPVGEPVLVSVSEGTSPITIVLKGKDGETVSGITYGISTPPFKGTLVPADSSIPNGDTWTFTPTADFVAGEDSFTYTVTDGDGQVSETPATVTIQIHKALDGWVGNKEQGDSTVVKAIPGDPLKLSAVSSISASAVKANVNGTEATLTLANASTFAVDGYKRWVNSTFVLANETEADEYRVVFTALDAGGLLLQTELASKLIDNDFMVLETKLTLTANPEKILGDGKATTELSALIQDTDGNPIAGVEVVFTAPRDTGQFVGADHAVTDANGVAKVIYQSAQITGVNEQNIPLQAIVHDTELGLSAQDEVIITFLPAAVNGFITRGASNTPVAGARVHVTLDLNNDGKIEPGVDFDETVVTDTNGAYHVIVPKGNAVYDLEVTQWVEVGGVFAPVTYKQTARVGAVTGAGDESFDSEKTVTGIVLLKQPTGQSSLLSGDLLAKTTAYLRKADGSYVLKNGVPKAFELDGQGLFHADDLAVGEYELEIKYEIEPGKEITFGHVQVSVTASGEMNISEALVDPYGTITDSVTKAVIEGASVTLHYANTTRNKAKGIVPGDKVTLPALVGFEPNNNASPEQLSDAHGFYAYMVYPETDYYLLVTKDGYKNYRSPILSVEWEIVRHDLQLTPNSTAVTSVNPILSLSVDKNKVKEGTKSTVTVDYKNNSSSTITDGEIKVRVPAGAVIVDAAGGIVSNDTIVWQVTNVAGGQGGSFNIMIEWPLMKAADTAFEIAGEFTANRVVSKSSVKINVFSDRFGELTHKRYILGYPDKEFKPNGSLTRAELAAIVARLTENGKVDYQMPFTDIRKGHWATNYIQIATKHGYFSGYEDGSFRPDEPVTRGELASVMARFLKLEVSVPTSAHFKDTAGHWSGNTIEALYNGKFLTGYPDGSFKPKNEIIRVEAVTMINRMIFRGPLKGLAPLFPDMPESHWGFGDVQEATISHKAERNEDGSEKWIQTISDDVQ